MPLDEDLIDKLRIEVREIDGQYRQCFETAMGLSYAESESTLDAMAESIVSGLVPRSKNELRLDDIQSMKQGVADLEKRTKQSITKRRLLFSIALGRVYLRNVIGLAAEGNLGAAIGALSAASMVSGAVQVARAEIESRAAPGKSSSAKRKQTYERLSAAAIARWRMEISPALSATVAAEKLRAMGIPLSHDKLSRLISAEKRAVADNANDGPLDGTHTQKRVR